MNNGTWGIPIDRNNIHQDIVYKNSKEQKTGSSPGNLCSQAISCMLPSEPHGLAYFLYSGELIIHFKHSRKIWLTFNNSNIGGKIKETLNYAVYLEKYPEDSVQINFLLEKLKHD